ncbi:hypothetical protein [Mycobacterium uberis]|uniref:hypothetical protein n=1 Tax=Mycobacterium uberis TaxID=2162698 RepID=UPI001FB4C391|nr:hypothetical protein [Mycobacterium uberis]
MAARIPALTDHLLDDARHVADSNLTATTTLANHPRTPNNLLALVVAGTGAIEASSVTDVDAAW